MVCIKETTHLVLWTSSLSETHLQMQIGNQAGDSESHKKSVCADKRSQGIGHFLHLFIPAFLFLHPIGQTNGGQRSNDPPSGSSALFFTVLTGGQTHLLPGFFSSSPSSHSFSFQSMIWPITGVVRRQSSCSTPKMDEYRLTGRVARRKSGEKPVEMGFRKCRGSGQDGSNNREGSLPFSTRLMAIMAQLIISLRRWSRIEEKNSGC